MRQCYGEDCPDCKIRLQAEQALKEGDNEKARKFLEELAHANNVRQG